MNMPEFPHAISSINVIAASDISGIRKSIDDHKPFISKGLANKWPLLREVSQKTDERERISLIRDLMGDSRIRFTLTPPEQNGDLGIGGDLKANFRFNDQCTSAEKFLGLVADLVRAPTGACAYAQALKLGDFPDVLSRVQRLDSIVDPADFRYSRMWIGNGNHVVDLHYDFARNFIAMVDGVKRITLIPPEALPYIYPAPLHKSVGGVTRSLVKLLRVDHEKFPRFVHALELAQMTVVEPGDILFIPPLWWHHVESYNFNVMVNSWYEDNPPKIKVRVATARATWRKAICQSAGSNATKHNFEAALDSLHELPENWRDYFKILYDYYVLRTYGDPYPTLPGAMTQVVRSIWIQRWRRLQQRFVSVARRLITGITRRVKLRQIVNP